MTNNLEKKNIRGHFEDRENVNCFIRFVFVSFSSVNVNVNVILYIFRG